VKTETKTDK